MLDLLERTTRAQLRVLADLLEVEHRALTEKLGERMEEWEALENQLAGLPKP